MALTPIRRLLTGAARRAGITRDLEITSALRACQRELASMFGAAYSKFAEPVAVTKEGGLVIACRSPAVAQTIRLRDATVLRTVRAAAPRLTIERIILVPRSRDDARPERH
ncbi:DUF721 domain-containing protein [Candidatus Uhrbacteria bacterium]|nr:DUF721 domain-containing protein [Candidatus Uhrbacteria bacterium]